MKHLKRFTAILLASLTLVFSVGSFCSVPEVHATGAEMYALYNLFELMTASYGYSYASSQSRDEMFTAFDSYASVECPEAWKELKDYIWSTPSDKAKYIALKTIPRFTEVYHAFATFKVKYLDASSSSSSSSSASSSISVSSADISNALDTNIVFNSYATDAFKADVSNALKTSKNCICYYSSSIDSDYASNSLYISELPDSVTGIVIDSTYKDCFLLSGNSILSWDYLQNIIPYRYMCDYDIKRKEYYIDNSFMENTLGSDGTGYPSFDSSIEESFFSLNKELSLYVYSYDVLYDSRGNLKIASLSPTASLPIYRGKASPHSHSSHVTGSGSKAIDLTGDMAIPTFKDIAIDWSFPDDASDDVIADAVIGAVTIPQDIPADDPADNPADDDDLPVVPTIPTIPTSGDMSILDLLLKFYNAFVTFVNNFFEFVGSIPKKLSEQLSVLKDIREAIKSQPKTDGSSALAPDLSDIREQFKVIDGGGGSDPQNEPEEPKVWLPVVPSVAKFLKPVLEFLGKPLSEITKFLKKISDTITDFAKSVKEFITEFPLEFPELLKGIKGKLQEIIEKFPIEIPDILQTLKEIKNKFPFEIPNLKELLESIREKIPFEIPDYRELLELIKEAILGLKNDVLDQALPDLDAIAKAIADNNAKLEDKANLKPFKNFIGVLKAYHFGSDYPIISMQTPAIILTANAAVGDRIILFNGEDFAVYFIWVRKLLSASFILGYAYCIIRKFKVRLTI